MNFHVLKNKVTRYISLEKNINLFRVNHYKCNHFDYTILYMVEWILVSKVAIILMFLMFVLVPENVEEKLKRRKIEAALADPDTPLSKWQEFAKSEYGLVSGKNTLNEIDVKLFFN